MTNLSTRGEQGLVEDVSSQNGGKLKRRTRFHRHFRETHITLIYNCCCFFFFFLALNQKTRIMQEASGAFHILLQAPKLCPELRSVAVFAQYI